MARARRKKEPSVFAGSGEGQPVVRVLPEVCPLCQASCADDATAHLHSHAPAERCQRCDAKDKGGRLDLDGVQHFRQDVSVFYCSGCGRYAPPSETALGGTLGA